MITDILSAVKAYLAALDDVPILARTGPKVRRAADALDALRAAASVDIGWRDLPPTEPEVIAHHAAHSFALTADATEEDKVSLWLHWKDDEWGTVQSCLAFFLPNPHVPGWLVGGERIKRLGKLGGRWMPLTAARLPAPWPKVSP